MCTSSAGFTVSSGRAVQQKDGQMAERSRGLKGRKAMCVSVCQHIDISSGPHCPSSCLTRVSGEWMAGLFSLQKMSFGSAGWHREWGTHWSYLLVSKFIFNMNPDCFFYQLNRCCIVYFIVADRERDSAA